MRLAAVLLPCLLLAGCLGYGYPSLSRTPGVAVPAEEVRAFRVVSELTMSGPWMTGPIELSESVEEIPVKNGRVEPQRDAYFAYYYLAFPILNGSRDRALEVLLYRPGYETVTVPAGPGWLPAGGSGPEKVAWKEAPDLLTQKAAVDRIVSNPHHRKLSKGVLRFAAREYARLADSPVATRPEMATTREGLRLLAAECRELAEKESP